MCIRDRVNPPVALMFHEGARRIVAAGVHVPALCEGDASRIALEAYPGLLARKQLAVRESYKSDTRSEHTSARKAARRKIIEGLKMGKPLGIRLDASRRLEKRALDDGSGDTLDAVICAVQAAWGWQRRTSNYGLPADAPAGEGWIVTA